VRDFLTRAIRYVLKRGKVRRYTLKFNAFSEKLLLQTEDELSAQLVTARPSTRFWWRTFARATRRATELPLVQHFSESMTRHRPALSALSASAPF
jgi:hypothetical protein